MDPKQAQEQAQEAAEWVACDPFAVVEAAKQSLYGPITQKFQNEQELLAPINEALSRLEHITRSLGTSVTTNPVGVGGSRS